CDCVYHRLVTEMEVSLVDQHSRVRRCLDKLQKVFTCDQCAGGIVGTGHGDESGLGGDGRKYFFHWKTELVLRIGLNRNDACARALGINLKHRESRDHDQDFVVLFEIGFTNQMDGFIHAVSKKNLLWFQCEMPGSNGLRWIALWIDCEPFVADLSQFGA